MSQLLLCLRAAIAKLGHYVGGPYQASTIPRTYRYALRPSKALPMTAVEQQHSRANVFECTHFHSLHSKRNRGFACARVVMRTKWLHMR